MIIAIDTEELDRLKNLAFKMGDCELKTNCQMLIYYAKVIYNEYNANNEYFSKYQCMRNPVIIEDDNFIKHLKQHTGEPVKVQLSTPYGVMKKTKK